MNSTTHLALQATVLKEVGVLYVEVEYYLAETVSIWRANQPEGGPFQSLTTTYEWWLDALNPRRFRRVTVELLESGPQLISADGSNGLDAWWELDVSKRITQPTRHEGLYPFGATREGQTEMTFDRWLGIFTRTGQRLTDELRRGEVQQAGQTREEPWGNVNSIRRTNSSNGNTTTLKIRAEAPHVLIERVQVDSQGRIVMSDRITRWEWLNPAQLSDSFWMTPPNATVLISK